MTQMPQAHLTYHPSLKPENRSRYSATCPTHNKNSLQLLSGTQPDFEGKTYLVFVCKEKGRHTFNALPDKSAPKSPEETGRWIKEQTSYKPTRTQS